jgi:hypothetical protein
MASISIASGLRLDFVKRLCYTVASNYDKQLMEVVLMKRIVALITILLFAVSCFALIGCGKKEEPKPVMKPVPAAKPAPAPPAPAKIQKKAPAKPAAIKKSAPKKAKKAKGMKKK